jgi:predicted CopG family antitoxin
MFDGVKVFSATKHKERDELGEVVTRWLRNKKGTIELVDKQVTQSSDSEYHCVTIIVFYNEL